MCHHPSLCRYNVSSPAVQGASYTVFVSAWDVWTNQYGQRLAAAPAVLVVLPSIISSIEGGDRIPSPGGTVRLTGVNFGSADSVLVARLFNESSEVKSATCRTFVTYADCTASEGVGRNYTWQLVVDGYPGEVSSAMTHYAPPAVHDLTGPGQVSSSRYVCLCLYFMLPCVG